MRFAPLLMLAAISTAVAQPPVIVTDAGHFVLDSRGVPVPARVVDLRTGDPDPDPEPDPGTVRARIKAVASAVNEPRVAADLAAIHKGVIDRVGEDGLTISVAMQLIRFSTNLRLDGVHRDWKTKVVPAIDREWRDATPLTKAIMREVEAGLRDAAGETEAAQEWIDAGERIRIGAIQPPTTPPRSIVASRSTRQTAPAIGFMRGLYGRRR